MEIRRTYICTAEFEALKICHIGRNPIVGAIVLPFFTRDSQVAFSKLMHAATNEEWRGESGRRDAYHRISRATELGGKRHELFRAFQASRCYVIQYPLRKSDSVNHDRVILFEGQMSQVKRVDSIFTRALAVKSSLSALKEPRLHSAMSRP